MRPTKGPELTETLWELRNGEILDCAESELCEAPYGFAVRIVPVPLPPGPVAPYKGKTTDAPEHCALVVAERDNEGRWQWLWLGPSTKQWLIDWLVDEVKIERDRWYYVGIHKDPMIIGAQVMAKEYGPELEDQAPPNAP